MLQKGVLSVLVFLEKKRFLMNTSRNWAPVFLEIKRCFDFDRIPNTEPRGGQSPRLLRGQFRYAHGPEGRRGPGGQAAPGLRGGEGGPLCFSNSELDGIFYLLFFNSNLFLTLL